MASRIFRIFRLFRKRRSAANANDGAPLQLLPGDMCFDEVNEKLYFGKEDKTIMEFTAGGGGGGGTSYTVLSDFDTSTSYIGIAPVGSATSADVWTIRRTLVMPDGSIAQTDEFTDVAWDARLSLV